MINLCQIRHEQKGLTLIELLIVSAIIGILAFIAVPIFLSERSKALHTEAKSNLQSLSLLEEQYFAENGCYYRNASNNCANTDLSSVSDIKTFFPGFQPGLDTNLNFNYRIVISGNPSATAFLATAIGKTTSPVAGATFSIDHNNNRNF